MVNWPPLRATLKWTSVPSGTGEPSAITVAVTTWELPARSGLGADWVTVIE